MKNLKTHLLPIIAVLSLILGSCHTMTGRYGAMTPDDKVTAVFKKAHRDPNLNYYYSGSGVYPNAILGVKKEYTLDSTLWKKLDVKQEEFEYMLSYMRTKAAEKAQYQYGFTIYDDKGNPLGIYYSLLSQTPAVIMKDDRTVMIMTPPQGLYYEGDDKDDKKKLP